MPDTELKKRATFKPLFYNEIQLEDNPPVLALIFFNCFYLQFLKYPKQS